MSSTDDRIVKMQFDNAQFKKGAAETKQSLADLNKATEATGKSKGLLDLNSNMERVSVTASKMAVVTTTALATIANKATNVALSLASSLTLDPIKSGFSEYESLLTKQNVIMNATGKSAAVVKGVLNDLNKYSDKTVFSFNDMTEGMTSFVNAGVPLKQAAQAMKGIANASALAGASTLEAQSSFRAFGQAMGNGFLGLQDFRQASITGKIGTVQFKQSLIDAAVEVGTLTKRGKEYVTENGTVLSATKNFDNSLQHQWASSKVLNKALGEYANTQSALGKKAFKAAQDVRTFSAFMDTLKESLGSGWSGIFTNLFGGLEDSTKLWTGLSNAVGKVVNSFFNWINVSLSTWRALGGFNKTVDALKNVLSPIGAIFSTISKAMNEAFPNSGKGAGKGLYAFSSALELVTRPLRLVAWLIEQLATPLTVVLKLIKIGGATIRAFVGSIIDLVEKAVDLVHLDVPTGDSGFLGWIKKVGDALVSPIDQISEMLDKGKSLKQAFSSISLPDLPKVSLPGLPDFGGKAGDASGKAAGGLSKVQKVLANIGKVMKSVAKGAKAFISDLFNSGDEVGSVFSKIGDILQKIGEGIKFVFDKIDWDTVLASFNLAVFSAFLLTFTRLMDTIRKGIEGVAGFGEAGKNVLEQTGNALKSFQTQARAKLILNIGIAIALLAASLWVLSKIPADKLATSLVAMGALFVMLNLTMKNFTKLLNAMDGKKMSLTAIALSVSIAALAFAMILMAGALLLMNRVKWGSLVKGLVSMFALIKSMDVLGNMAEHAAKNMAAGAFAIALISGSMLVLAAALLAFKLVDFESMGKAGLALAGVALAVGLLALMPAEAIAKVGVAMLTTSVGMVAMAAALIMFKLVDWESIGKLSVVLLALGISLGVMMALGGPVLVSGLIGLGVGLLAIAAAGIMLNKVSWQSIGKLVVVLTILTLALAAIGLVSYVVGPALILLGVAFVLLGVGLAAFATAMAIAITVGAAGTAAFAALATGAAVAIAAFLTSLALQAPIMKDSFLKILQTLIDTVVEATPMIIQGFKDLWNAVKKELGGGDKGGKGADMQKAGSSWISNISNGIKQKLPEIVAKAAELAGKFIMGLTQKAPMLGAVAAVFIARFIGGIASKLGGIIQSGANLIIAWIRGITTQAARIADAAAKAVIKFINSMADSIEANSAELVKAMANLGTAMVKGLIKGVTDMAGDSLSAIGGIAKGMIDKAKGILKIFSPSRVFASIGKFLVLGLTKGIQDNAASAIAAVASMVTGQIAVANEYVSKYIQDLDQKALAARSRADGLAAAAKKAADEASKTKNKKDDKGAALLQKQADAADKAATVAENTAQRAKDAQDRAEQFNAASTIDKARMRSEDAQSHLDEAKRLEAQAAAERTQAAALVRQSKGRGITAKERKALLDQAAALQKKAAADAKRANDQLVAAKNSAAASLAYQKLAGDEAAAAFQAAFESDAKAAADEEAFSKLTNEEKAIQRRKQAADLQMKAEQDLAKAKTLAYTDIEAANELAATALQEAEQARKYLDEANDFSQSKNTSSGVDGGVLGTVINLQPTEDAAIRMRDYEDLYAVGVEGASSGPSIEFTQINNSPESLSPTELYRNTNNQFTFAVDKIDELTNNR